MTLIAASSEILSVYQAYTVGDGVPVARAGAPIRARVISTFSTGFYVQLGDGRIFAVGGPQIPAGPIHHVLKHTAPRPIAGTAVHIDPATIRMARATISVRHGTRFRPFRPDPHCLIQATPNLSQFFVGYETPDDIRPVLPSLISVLQAGDLNAARQILQGRGSGLTPTGDDVLAGLLLFHAWAGTSTRQLETIATNAKTTDLSKAFLIWAARGQSIQPVHDLARAAWQLSLERRPDRARLAHDEMNCAARTLRGIGHSSGAALLAGLGLAANLLTS